jgi:hypothetical protein
MAKGQRNLKGESWWRRMVRGQAKSGMTIRAYCAQRRVKESAFYWWRRELARRDAAKPAAFVAVRVHSPSALDRVDGMVLELRGGRMLRLGAMTVSQVVELARAMEGAA